MINMNSYYDYNTEINCTIFININKYHPIRSLYMAVSFANVLFSMSIFLFLPLQTNSYIKRSSKERKSNTDHKQRRRRKNREKKRRKK